jgi:hypothetical protein
MTMVTLNLLLKTGLIENFKEWLFDEIAPVEDFIDLFIARFGDEYLFTRDLNQFKSRLTANYKMFVRRFKPVLDKIKPISDIYSNMSASDVTINKLIDLPNTTASEFSIPTSKGVSEVESSGRRNISAIELEEEFINKFRDVLSMFVEEFKILFGDSSVII